MQGRRVEVHVTEGDALQVEVIREQQRDAGHEPPTTLAQPLAEIGLADDILVVTRRMQLLPSESRSEDNIDDPELLHEELAEDDPERDRADSAAEAQPDMVAWSARPQIGVDRANLVERVIIAQDPGAAFGDREVEAHRPIRPAHERQQRGGDEVVVHAIVGRDREADLVVAGDRPIGIVSHDRDLPPARRELPPEVVRFERDVLRHLRFARHLPRRRLQQSVWPNPTTTLAGGGTCCRSGHQREYNWQSRGSTVNDTRSTFQACRQRRPRLPAHGR